MMNLSHWDHLESVLKTNCDETMPDNKDFVNYIADMLQDLGQIDARYMFGDWGLYLDGVFFAIIDDDRLYVKADEKNRHLFEKHHLEQFSYMRQQKKCYLNYYAVPEDAIDDMDKLKYWAETGYQAALHANRS